MSTPESKVKDAVKKRLAHYGVYSHTQADKHPGELTGSYFMPVAGPFQVHGIHDFIGCWGGVFFSIETKAPTNPDDETPAQRDFRVTFTRAGGICLTGVRGPEGVDQLARLVQQGNAESSGPNPLRVTTAAELRQQAKSDPQNTAWAPLYDQAALDAAVAAERKKARNALLLASGALCQCSPCGAEPCHAEQVDWLEDARAAVDQALKA